MVERLYRQFDNHTMAPRMLVTSICLIRIQLYLRTKIADGMKTFKIDPDSQIYHLPTNSINHKFADKINYQTIRICIVLVLKQPVHATFCAIQMEKPTRLKIIPRYG